MRKDALKHHAALLNKTVLAIDPASKSMGYALFQEGELVASGVFEAPALSNVLLKMKHIYGFIQQMVKKHDVSLLVIEQIRTTSKAQTPKGEKQHYKFFAPYQLLFAVGAICAAAPSAIMEMPATSWKKVARREGMGKSDRNDAVCIGMRAIELAEEEYSEWVAKHKKR